MKVSVLMSVYQKDDPTFLKISLQSIYEKQSRKPDEIVVIFDGPLTKELYAVLDAFARDKQGVVRYFPQQENRGLGEALRVGTEYCTGEYIFRMDADDISHPRRFERQIEYLEAHPRTDVLGGNIAEFDHSPKAIKRHRICPATQAEILKRSRHRNPMNHMTVCIRKEALLTCGGYQTLLYAEDYYLWLRMLAKGCIFANLRENLVYVRVGNGFNARRSSRKIISSWKVLQKFMLKHGMIKRYEAWLNLLCMGVFIHIPGGLKEWVYTTFLRKKEKRNYIEKQGA